MDNCNCCSAESAKWCITCGGLLDPNNCWCCRNNGANQVEDEKNKEQKTNLLKEGAGPGISAPKSNSMQRFTNLRY